MPPISLAFHLRSKRLLNLRDLIPTISRRTGNPHLPSLSARAATAPDTFSNLQPKTNLIPRQNQDVRIIPTGYNGLDAGPPPGTVVGIVLGSVAGFLLLLWLIYTIFNRGGAVEADEYVVRERRRSRSRSRSRTPLPPQPRPMSVRHSPPRPPPPPIIQERVIIEERRPPPPPQPQVVQERVIIEDRRDDDVVEVIEEHSPPRRSRSGRNRTSGGFRTVDPDAYGGGNRPQRKVSRR